MASRQSVIRRRYQDKIKKRGSIECGLCGGRITNPNDVTVDHILPVSLGGSNRVINFQPTHQKCNWDRGNKPTILSDIYNKRYGERPPTGSQLGAGVDNA